MYRLICCDLDETLLTSTDKSVSPRNREAVQRARAKGVKFVPSTGRGFSSIGKTLRELSLDGAADEYVISLNGGAITEIGGEKLLYFEALPRKLAEELFARGVGYGIGMQVHTKDETLFYNLTEKERAFHSGRLEMKEFFTPNLDFLKGQDIAKIVFADPDIPHLQEIEKELRPILGDVNVTYSSNRFLEFNHKGVSKGQGLLRLAEHLGIPCDETIAIGDNYNDVSMIQTAGLGVCVQNASDEIKVLSDYVTKATHDEDAIAEVIDKFVL